MAVNPYSLEMSTIEWKCIPEEVINKYIDDTSVRLDIESLLEKEFPDGITFQAWWTYIKDTPKDIAIRDKIKNMAKDKNENT